MTNKKLNRLLSILDEHEISLDITAEELKLLPNDLVDVLENVYKTSDIIVIILATLKGTKSKVEHENELLACPPILGELEPLIGHDKPDLTPCKPLRYRSDKDMPEIIDFADDLKLLEQGPPEEVYKRRILTHKSWFKK